MKIISWIRLSIMRMSLQKRLPLLIFVLLLSIIVTFSTIAYMGVRSDAMKVGHERLQSLTQQLSSLFGQSAQAMMTATKATANQPSIKQNLLSGGKEQRTEALDALGKLGLDKQSVMIGLLDANYQQLLHITKDSIAPRFNYDSLLSKIFITTDSNSVGSLYYLKDSLYYPVLVPVTDNKKVIGYIVRWRIQYSTSKAIEQFSQLIGEDAALFIGNADGSLWSDLMKTVEKPPLNKQPGTPFFEYNNLNNKPVVAAAQAIPFTHWVVLVEFSKQRMVASANRFLSWVIIAGGIIIAIGLLLTWILSRSITKPLKKLTAATSAIAKGDYSLPVETKRADEIGELARSFSIMTEQVHLSQQTLENKVQERTSQLETVNKELEAFSYSVSHDLRAPLRAINGYATILKEDYTDKIDEEANRLADKIISNAKKMGQLIDDLIAFSQMGAREITYRKIDMHKLAEQCVTELLQNEPQGKYKVDIQPLPPCLGDETLIRQVWLNLISNAIKYSSKQAAPYFEIGHTEKDNMSTYFIHDNGVGFGMQYAHKLFGVFQRLHSPKEFEGNGIGLAFVKRIISKHNGEISAESVPGGGASFYFSLPKSV
jgi:signal transduction histidine kinase